MTELSCPKCQAPMRQYERSGVTIDRCTECGGLFLDRGELERLADAEGQYNTSRGWVDDDRTRGYDHDDEHQRHGRRRRGGFLGELFD
jgi:uncharacterized protein